ncbi:hypothetical protein YC2023_115312 [Brassica napus]
MVERGGERSTERGGDRGTFGRGFSSRGGGRGGPRRGRGHHGGHPRQEMDTSHQARSSRSERTRFIQFNSIHINLAQSWPIDLAQSWPIDPCPSILRLMLKEPSSRGSVLDTKYPTSDVGRDP